jgi:hypothetical protein
VAENTTYAVLTIEGTMEDLSGLIMQIRGVAGLFGLTKAEFKQPEPLPPNDRGVTHSMEIILKGSEPSVQAILKLMAGQADNREEAKANLALQTKKAREEMNDGNPS